MADTPNQIPDSPKPVDPPAPPAPQAPSTPIPPIAPAPSVVEHPISEDDTKKYAGLGDYSLPVSPLDQLLESDQDKTAPEPPKQPEITYESFQPPKPPVEPPAQPQSGPAPILPQPTQPDTAMPKPVNPPNLETKAKDMLKTLDKAAPPKRKRSGSMATKMALAAVVVVMMGAGGFVGMNILNQNKAGNVAVVENRSQAGGPTDQYCNVDNCEPCTNGKIICTGKYNDGSACTTEQMCGDGIKCNCCKSDGTTGWTTGSGNDCGTLCKEKGFADEVGGGSCPSMTSCYCANWSNGCGTDCVFPGGFNCNSSAAGTCSQYIGMCDINGNVSCEEFKPGHRCWGLQDECDNPISTDTCDNSSYQCTSLTKDKSPTIGQTVTFTCNGSATGVTINHYEFQYKIGTGAYATLDAASVGSKTSKPLTITKTGAYTVQCRACKSAGSTECTTWGLAK